MRTKLACFTVLLASCSLADPDLFRALEGDGGMVDTGTEDAPMVDAPGEDTGGEDAGPTGVAVDRCGDDDVMVLVDSTPDIEIDTTSLTNRTGSLPGCGNLQVPGNEGFLAVQVGAGEEWHFHLRPEDTTAELNPTLYLLNESCSATMCAENLLANFCDGTGDEHFAFTFSTPGTWYIGIDDTNAGGGRYLLDAIRPVCGDDTPEHGEACDGGDGCGTDCRFMLTNESTRERGFNFNFKEANRIMLPSPDNRLIIQGDIGGFAGCAYPDVYAIDVPAGGTLRVEQRNSDGDACTGSGAAEIDLSIRDASNNIRATSSSENGCAVAEETFASAGLFFIVMEDARLDTDSALPYQLMFSVTP